MLTHRTRCCHAVGGCKHSYRVVLVCALNIKKGSAVDAAEGVVVRKADVDCMHGQSPEQQRRCGRPEPDAVE